MEKETPGELTLEGVQQKTMDAIVKIRDEWKADFDKWKADGVDHGEHYKALEKKTDNAIRRMDEALAMINNPNLIENKFGEYKTVGQLVSEAKGLQEVFPPGDGYRRGRSFDMPIGNINLEISPMEGGGSRRKAGSFFPEALAYAQALVPELKTTITTGTVGSGTSGVLMPARIPGIVSPPQPRIRVRQLIPRLPTTANAIDWVKESVFTEVVSPQTEASAKGESEMTFTTDTEPVRLIATWIPASRQVLDDMIGLMAFINMRLMHALMNEEDDQILRGDDTGQNLKGLSQASTAYTDGTYDQTGDTALDKLVRMITQLEDSNYEPSGFVLHPRNWRIITTIKADYGGGAGTGPYVLGGPSSTQPNFAWGLPVATSTRMTAGNAFCGDFINYVVLWDRMQARIDISTEHSDYFTKNLVAIRAEERVCLTVRDNGAILYESSL